MAVFVLIMRHSAPHFGRCVSTGKEPAFRHSSYTRNVSGNVTKNPHQMNQENILNGIKLRSLFDSFSHEFKSSTVENKILTLSALNKFGLLKKIIKDYQKNYKDQNRTDIVNEVNSTLNFFIKTLNPEKVLKTHGENKVKLSEIIEVLEKELKVFSDKNFSKERFIASFLENKDEEYEKQKKFFKIDLNKDITSSLSQRDEAENKDFQENYIHLYKFLKNNLIPNYRENNFVGFMIDMGFDYQSEYVVRFFLQEPNKENYFEAIEYAINILYFGKEPYHKFVLFRNNFGNPEQIKNFYDNGQTAIHLNTDLDFQDWEKYINGENPKQQYLQRWKSLTDLISKQDVIIISSFQGIGYKIGKVKQGTKFEKIVNGKSIYYLFKLENSKPINLDLFQFVQTILPANVTLSNVNRKNYSLRKIFPGVVCSISNFEMDDIAIEILVAEWLRSKYAPKEFKIKYQILKTGGNKKDIDISGITENDENLIVQVSNTENLETIKKKITKLDKYEDCKKLFFFNIPNQEIGGNIVIDIKNVIEDFRKDNYYHKLLTELN